MPRQDAIALRSTAASYFRRACEAGDQRGCVSLGAGLENNDEPQHAAPLYQQACEAGLGQGCTNLAFLLRDGKGVARDPDGARELFDRTCSADLMRGCYGLGSLHEKGTGVPLDLSRAAAYYDQACKGGYDPGCTALATLHEQGLGVSKDLNTASSLYFMACEREYGRACDRLGAFYAQGRGVEKSLQMAGVFWQMGCDYRDAGSCTSMGLLLADNDDVIQDKAAAIRFFLTACDLGNARGCAWVGWLLKGSSADTYRTHTTYRLDGTTEVTTLDLEPSQVYLERACNGDNAWGCGHLGELLKLSDSPRAVAAFQKSCDGGQPNRCVDLGRLLEGVDRGRAAAAYERACTAGEQLGCEELVSLRRSVLPVNGEISAGAVGYFWVPASAANVNIETRGYSATYVDARLLLLDHVDLWSLHYERSIGEGPSQGGGLAVADAIGAPAAIGRTLDAIGAIRVGDEDEWSHVVVRGRDERYSLKATLEKDLDVIDISAGETVFSPLPIGSTVRMETAFTEIFLGAGGGERDGGEWRQFAVGLSALSFEKPWKPYGAAEKDILIVSPLRSLGVGALGEGSIEPFGSRWAFSGEGQGDRI